MMQQVSATDLAKKFGTYKCRALVEPLSVTSSGREELVLMSRAEYLKLRRGYREAIKTADLSDNEVDLIMNAKPAEGSEQYDHEVVD